MNATTTATATWRSYGFPNISAPAGLQLAQHIFPAVL